jgi:signal transduction histidine kinase
VARHSFVSMHRGCAARRSLAWGVLATLVVVELVLLIPLIITQQQKDQALAAVQLNTFNSVLVLRVQRVVNQVAYGVKRTAALTLLGTNGTRTLLTQYQYEQGVQLGASPYVSDRTTTILILRVRQEERAAYETFNGFPITHINRFGNATEPSPEKPEYLAMTRFVPGPDQPTLVGIDMWDPPVFASIGVLIQNETEVYLAQAHGTLAGKGLRRWGIFIGAYNKDARAYAITRLEVEAILKEALIAPRDQVVVGAWGVWPRESFQLLYLDDSPLLDNLTSIKRFNASENRDQFQTVIVEVLGSKIMFALKYSDELQAQYYGTVWISLAVILPCVCFVIDVGVVWLILAWQHLARLHLQEVQRHVETQRMMGYVSHEIRNPLQTIIGMAELELDNEADQSCSASAASWGAVLCSAEAIECVANDVLDLRLIQAGRLECHLGPVDVERLFTDLALAVRPLLQPNVRFATIIDMDAAAPAVYSDARRLRQILLNFLTNAAKFTSRGSVALEYAVMSAKTGRFAVRDTGRGIPVDKQQVVFHEFQQVEQSDSLGGFGLGLHLCGILAKRLEIELGFESVVDEGTVFWAVVPLETPHVIWADFDSSTASVRKST